MSTSEPPSPADEDEDAAALRHDCAAATASCDSPSARQSERVRVRVCEKVSPALATPPPADSESESKATQEVLTREDLLGKKISYAGGHTGMRAREDEEERWVRLWSERQRQRYEAWVAAKRTKIPDTGNPKASSNDSNLTPVAASPAQPTPPGHKSDSSSSSSSDTVSAPEPEPDPGSLATKYESTQKQKQEQDPDDKKTTRRAPAVRRTKSARWSEGEPFDRRM